MRSMMISPDAIVVLSGALLVAALFFVRRLARELPPGVLRRRWCLIGVVIFLVIAGYAAHVGGVGSARLSNLLVPMVFFLGACIVLVLCATAVETAHDVRRVAALEIQTLLDPLTGLYNRRYLDDRLRQEVERAQRYGLPLSVLLLDVDHFKRVNDTWGHLVGDAALIALGQLLRNAVRPQDIAVRYGGEEVVVVTPDTDLSGAEELAERLRRTIMETVLVAADGNLNREALRLTVSVGVAVLRLDNDAAQNLLRRADSALYAAKRAGRNRVAVESEADE